MPLVMLLWSIVISIPCLLWDELLINSLTAHILQFLVILHQTGSINSMAHKYGMKPYNTGIEPRFSKIGSYLTLGEGYHNFHHTFPYDYSTSQYTWLENYNISTLIIDFFALIGWAYDRKVVFDELVAKRIERTGDKNVKIKPKNLFIEYILGIFIYTSFLWVIVIIRLFTLKISFGY
jgi:stearoyl-CoA desaturase (delta-9 desaturase)